jgi:hypothetical protein
VARLYIKPKINALTRLLPVQATLLRQNNIVAFGQTIIASILIVVSQYCDNAQHYCLCATFVRDQAIIVREGSKK